MIVILSLIAGNLIVGLYYTYLSRMPVLCEYKPGWYTIRSGNTYLDIDSYKRFSAQIWKSDKEGLFQLKCVMHNLPIAKSILKDLYC